MAMGMDELAHYQGQCVQVTWATETECGDSQSGTVCTSVQPQASSSSLLTVLRAGNTGTRWMATVKGYCYAIGYRVEVELAAHVGRESGGKR